MSNKFPYIKLKEICDVNQGLQIAINERFTEPATNRFFYITVQFLKDSHTNKYYVENPPISSICYEDDILVVRTGSTGQIVTGVSGCFHNNFFKVNYNRNLVHGRYLYHILNTKEKYKDMLRRAGVTTIPDLNHFMFLDIEIPLPTKEKQIEIAKTLDVICSKIELNNLINAQLEAMAKTLYDYWFVQFDFPYSPPLEGCLQDGAVKAKPYKSSGGKMVYNEDLKREIPDGWEVKKLGDFYKIFDSKRIPLSKAERKKIKGDYPYYGATGVMDYVNNFIFNDHYLLVAEDGSVMDENGKLIVQFIWGKTWVNNHAHVIQANSKADNEFLFQVLKRISAIQITTGSIQLKINQDNLNSVLIVIPPRYLLDLYSAQATTLRKRQISICDENQQLAQLRDWLLPMLMNGQVTVNTNTTVLNMAAEDAVGYGK